MLLYSQGKQKDVPGHFDWLHPSEYKVLAGFRFEKRRDDWLLGRWTAKNLLRDTWFKSNKLNDIAILAGENRAPEIFFADSKTKVDISISHSHGRSFCVTGHADEKIGCDLEKIESRSEHFYQDYFTETERGDSEKYEEFLSNEAWFSLCWSAKESVMKAQKMGMSIHPKKIEIEKILLGDENWNEVWIKQLDSGQSFIGWWTIENEMVYVMVKSFEI